VPSAPTLPFLENGTCHDMEAWAARISTLGVAAIVGSDRAGQRGGTRNKVLAVLCVFAWRSVDAAQPAPLRRSQTADCAISIPGHLMERAQQVGSHDGKWLLGLQVAGLSCLRQWVSARLGRRLRACETTRAARRTCGRAARPMALASAPWMRRVMCACIAQVQQPHIPS
jgi:hypothetical protein